MVRSVLCQTSGLPILRTSSWGCSPARGRRRRTISNSTSGRRWGTSGPSPTRSCTASRPGWRPWVWSRSRARRKADGDASSRSRRPGSRPWKHGSIDHPRHPQSCETSGSSSSSSPISRHDEARLRLAEQQLAIHSAKLASYREDERLERSAGWAATGPTDGRALARRDVAHGCAVRERGSRVLDGRREQGPRGRRRNLTLE